MELGHLDPNRRDLNHLKFHISAEYMAIIVKLGHFQAKDGTILTSRCLV